MSCAGDWRSYCVLKAIMPKKKEKTNCLILLFCSSCATCNKRFPRESELASHQITHLPKEEYPFVCCKCARRFTTQQLLRHHEKKHIPMEERLIHPCEICKSMWVIYVNLSSENTPPGCSPVAQRSRTNQYKFFHQMIFQRKINQNLSKKSA